MIDCELHEKEHLSLPVILLISILLKNCFIFRAIVLPLFVYLSQFSHILREHLVYESNNKEIHGAVFIPEILKKSRDSITVTAF